MNKKLAQEIIEVMASVIPEPKCELNYNNHFELLLAVMLSAQTTDKRVNLTTPRLFEKYPNPSALAKANYGDVLEIIKSLGLAKTKAKNIIETARILEESYDSVVPNDFKKLENLPGVGRKTANVLLAEGFKIPSFPVDTHVYRLSLRLGFRKESDSLLVAEEKLKKYINKEDWIRGHHLFILFGRSYCKAINPSCDVCPLKNLCKEYKKVSKNAK